MSGVYVVRVDGGIGRQGGCGVSGLLEHYDGESYTDIRI